MTTVSIVVPTYRRPDSLRRTVEALTTVDYPSGSLELIVVDDGADPATSDVLERFRVGGMRIRTLRQERLGAAAARNAGARAATGEVLLFCDDDFVIRREHIKLHMSTRHQFGDVLVGGQWWYSPEVIDQLRSTPFGRFRLGLESGFRAQRREVRLSGACVETGTLSSCDLSIGRDTFWRLGGFDESFPYAGTEDQDLCLRAQAAGYRLIRNLGIQPLHNDSWVTLRQFCEREQRGAQTVAVLARKHPEVLGDFGRHSPIRRGDSAALVSTKLLKSALSGRRQLGAMHALVPVLERSGASDAMLATVYHKLIALHLFRGYREGLANSRSDSLLPAATSTADSSHHLPSESATDAPGQKQQ